MKPNRLIFGLLALAAGALFSLPALAGPIPKANSGNAEARKLIDQAWALEKKESSAQTYKQCITLLEKADKLDPDNPEILIELARYYWNYGDNLPKQTKEQQEKLEDLYEKGLDYAERSLDLKESVGAHYWIAVDKAAGLEFSSIFSQAAGFPSVYIHAEKAKELDPQYDYGGTGRLWSEILTRVPRKVVDIVGWDVQDAVDEINKSIEIEPRYLDNYVYKARFMYIFFGDKEEALKLLDHVLKQDPETLLPDEVTANKVSQKNARELWKQITGKEYPKR